MSNLVIGLIGIAVLLCLILTGCHVVVALGLVGFIGIWMVVGFDQAITLIGSTMYSKVVSFDFLAVAYFSWVGMLAASTGLSSRLYNSLRMWLGRIPGGLGVATTLCCAAFGTINGSSIATSMIFAKMAAPEMRKAGYNKELAYGLCASAGNIGMLIPPSSLIIIYGIISEQPIGQLLIAGISPGVILTLVFSLQIVAVAIFKPGMAPSANVSCTWREKIQSLSAFIPFIIIAGIVVGGISSGLFSIAESAAAAALVVVIIAFLNRASLKEILNGAVDTISSTAMIMAMMVAGNVFAKFLMYSGAVNSISTWFIGLNLGPTAFLIACVVIYLILGCFLDTISELTITLPIFLPIMTQLGINSIQFAMVVILALHCGQITPPFGVNVFGVIGVAEKDVKIMDVFSGSMRFLIAMIIITLAFVFIPSLSTFLPALMA